MLRQYVFDCGSIKGVSPTMFNFKEGEVKATEFVVPCYLIVHPKGTRMWDTGTVADSAFDFIFGPPRQTAISNTTTFSALKDAKTKLIGPADYDVFGDGTLIIKSAPAPPAPRSKSSSKGSPILRVAPSRIPARDPASRPLRRGARH
jgi:hypothetical protein